MKLSQWSCRPFVLSVSDCFLTGRLEELRSCFADGYSAETQRATCTNGAQATLVVALPCECQTHSAHDLRSRRPQTFR